ncbi:unnamed protein product [Rotaria sp. Silwood2]|nr:unnamed protein product [Rotaria sp. Silwood2]
MSKKVVTNENYFLHHAFNEYNPFSKATTSIKLQSANTIATLSSSDQAPSYSSAITSIPVQQETENFSSNTNSIDLTL